MIQVKNDLFTIVFISLLPSFSICYLLGESKENFVNGTELNIEIHFRDAEDTVLLYAIDADENRFLIKIGEQFYFDRKIICSFNGLGFHEISRKDKKDGINYFIMKLKFENQNLYRNNEKYFGTKNDVILYNIFDKNASNKNQYIGLPFPEKSENKLKRTTFFLFNIQTQENQKNINNPLKHDIIGCVALFRISNIDIKFVKYGSELSTPDCYRSTFEMIFNNSNGSFKRKKTKLHNFDCSLEAMNTDEYCFADYFINNEKPHKYKLIDYTTEFVQIKLLWKLKVVNNYCIIDLITFDKNSVIRIYIDRDSKLKICSTEKDKTKCIKKIVHKISANVYYVLLIDIRHMKLTIKVYSGTENITILLDQMSGVFKEAKVGVYSNTTLCKTFIGNYAIQYDSKKFKKIVQKSSKVSQLPFYKVYLMELLMLAIILPMFTILLSITIAFVKSMKPAKTKKRSISNLYDEEIEMRHQCPSIISEKDEDVYDI